MSFIAILDRLKKTYGNTNNIDISQWSQCSGVSRVPTPVTSHGPCDEGPVMGHRPCGEGCGGTPATTVGVS